MRFWKKLKAGFSNSSAGWLANWLQGQSHAGKPVDRERALQLPVAWACIRITAQAISSMSLSLYEKTGDGARRKLDDDEIGNLLSISPNADQTPMEFWEGITSWTLANGNGYALKEEIGKRTVALLPVDSDQCHPRRNDQGDLVYKINDRGKEVTFPAEKIFHIKGFGFGGDIGMSPIRYGVNSFGLALATEESAGKFFANGLQASGLLSSDQIFTDEQRASLQSLMTSFTSSQNAGKMLVMEGGLKYSPISMKPEDAQMLETRRFNIEEICRWFGVPPIVIGHAAQGQTMWGSGVEQILIAWLTLGLNPMLTRIEQRIRKSLIPADRRGRVYAEYNRESLLQADSAAKANFLSTVTQNGLMTRNEGREKLNLPPLPGGDALTVQTNLAPVGLLGSDKEKETEK